MGCSFVLITHPFIGVRWSTDFCACVQTSQTRRFLCDYRVLEHFIDKNRPGEWAEGSKDTDQDKAGDDDVDILIDMDGTLKVEYRDAANN